MEVFFSASLSRTRKLLPLTQDLVKFIEDLGHTVITKHLVDPHYTEDPQWDKKLDPLKVYQQATNDLERADLLVTECTVPSFGAGFFIDKCLELKKPLLSLHYGEKLDNAPLMLRGRPEINLQMYTEENARFVLKTFFDPIQQT
jgi:hypothetical protein